MPFFYTCSRTHRHLHSFPTRRSSDLPSLPRSSTSRARLKSRGGGAAAPIFPRTIAASFARSLGASRPGRSEEHTSELQSRFDLVCRLLLEKKKQSRPRHTHK